MNTSKPPISSVPGASICVSAAKFVMPGRRKAVWLRSVPLSTISSEVTATDAALAANTNVPALAPVPVVANRKVPNRLNWPVCVSVTPSPVTMRPLVAASLVSRLASVNDELACKVPLFRVMPPLPRLLAPATASVPLLITVPPL